MNLYIDYLDSVGSNIGAVGGFAGGFSGTLLNGGDLGQAFKAGVVGGIVGGASGFLAFAAGGVTGNSINAILERMGRHAFANAWLSGMQGQNILSGAITGGASSPSSLGYAKFCRGWCRFAIRSVRKISALSNFLFFISYCILVNGIKKSKKY